MQKNIIIKNSFTRIKSLTQSAKWIDDALITELLLLIGDSFAGISSKAYLQKYFLQQNAFERKLRLYFDKEKLVGYCLLTFSKINLDQKQIVCIGASAAFYPAYRHGSNTVRFSVSESLKYWLLHPWQHVCYADTMLSPAMYRAIAKQVAIIYPQAKRAIPADFLALVGKLKHSFSIDKTVQEGVQNESSFICHVGRRTNYSQSEIDSFRSNEKPEIQYYCQINPNFDQGNALITVIPVNIQQLFEMAIKWIRQ
ncbi:hypothetical protein [Chitinimonas sp. BJB300]|uniref:hypothetical protein n=1 Tax=Chitinimonas sp. BJB300 TaxID=1559339 RepID=UPI000C0F5D98|nr:hypothetical protein [Chitinimonas sp. BJB300]PHV09765.1 hypothetical protein CSQ89_19900 [Chitinimonas sp. BJB300]TSJ85940.1 hypothetical protein FG002_017140 [Chitinimonas sp. BJB300]